MVPLVTFQIFTWVTGSLYEKPAGWLTRLSASYAATFGAWPLATGSRVGSATAPLPPLAPVAVLSQPSDARTPASATASTAGTRGGGGGAGAEGAPPDPRQVGEGEGGLRGSPGRGPIVGGGGAQRERARGDSRAGREPHVVAPLVPKIEPVSGRHAPHRQSRED